MRADMPSGVTQDNASKSLASAAEPFLASPTRADSRSSMTIVEPHVQSDSHLNCPGPWSLQSAFNLKGFLHTRLLPA